MNHINYDVKYTSQINTLNSEFKSRTTDLERKVFELENQVKLLLKLGNGSVNLESMIRREVLKVLSNK